MLSAVPQEDPLARQIDRVPPLGHETETENRHRWVRGWRGPTCGSLVDSTERSLPLLPTRVMVAGVTGGPYTVATDKTR